MIWIIYTIIAVYVFGFFSRIAQEESDSRYDLWKRHRWGLVWRIAVAALVVAVASFLWPAILCWSITDKVMDKIIKLGERGS